MRCEWRLCHRRLYKASLNSDYLARYVVCTLSISSVHAFLSASRLPFQMLRRTHSVVLRSSRPDTLRIFAMAGKCSPFSHVLRYSGRRNTKHVVLGDGCRADEMMWHREYSCILLASVYGEESGLTNKKCTTDCRVELHDDMLLIFLVSHYSDHLRFHNR